MRSEAEYGRQVPMWTVTVKERRDARGSDGVEVPVPVPVPDGGRGDRIRLTRRLLQRTGQKVPEPRASGGDKAKSARVPRRARTAARTQCELIKSVLRRTCRFFPSVARQMGVCFDVASTR